jgi:hypothetical protein
MPIPQPITQSIISTTAWGIPITDEVNRLTTEAADLRTQIEALQRTLWGPWETFPPMSAGWTLTNANIARTIDGKWVTMRGQITRSGADLSGAITFGTLPAGYRPAVWSRFPAAWSGGFIRIQISPAGDMQLASYTGTFASGQYFHVDGLMFGTAV